MNTYKIFSLEIIISEVSGSITPYTGFSFTITISLNPLGTLNGVVVKNTNSGQEVFEDLNISSENTYVIKASCPQVITSETSSFIIHNYYVKVEFSSEKVVYI